MTIDPERLERIVDEYDAMTAYSDAIVCGCKDIRFISLLKYAEDDMESPIHLYLPVLSEDIFNDLEDENLDDRTIALIFFINLLFYDGLTRKVGADEKVKFVFEDEVLFDGTYGELDQKYDKYIIYSY